jgi:hypothetical protein
MKFFSIVTVITTIASAAMLANLPYAMAGEKEEGFRTPTGNIHCLIYGGDLRCDMAENTAKLPPQPKDCNLDWGNAFGMSLTGTASRICHGDTIAGNHPVLGYGKTWRKNGFTCTSRTTGLTCTNRNKRGWEISKAKQRLF